MNTLYKLILIIFILISSSTFAQTTYSWNGGSGIWSVATNWTPNGVPTATDNVVITATGTYTVTLDGDSTINNLTIGGTSGVQSLSLSSRTLTINGTGTINDSGSVSLTTSTLAGSGTLTNYGTLTAYDGILSIDFDNAGTASFRHYCSINNAFTTQPNSIIQIYVNTSYNTLTIANGFTNHGLIYFTNGSYSNRGTIDITSGTLVNAADGTIQSTSIPLYSGYGNSILAELDNQGTVTISQGFILNEASATHTNSGTFEINTGGTLYLTQSGTIPSFTSTGSFTVDSAAVITLNGGTFNYNSGTFDLNGSLSATTTVLNFTPSFINTVVISLNNSTLNCTASFTNQNTLNFTSSTIAGSGSLINSGTLTAYDGILSIDFDNAGTASFRHYCSINNAFTTQPNSTIHIYINTSYNTLTIANGFTNHGLIYFTNGSYSNRGTIDITNGTLVNAPDGIIETNNLALYPGYSNSILAPLDNQGAMNFNNSMTINKANESHYNSGEIQLNNATVSFSGNQFENTMSGEIGGNGTLNVTGLIFVNNGSFIPGDYPGILNIQNDLPSAATAFLNFDLGGPIIGEFYNSLAVTQTANYNGTININLVDGFVPNVGEEFVLATCNNHTGTFLVQNGLSINGIR